MPKYILLPAQGLNMPFQFHIHLPKIGVISLHCGQCLNFMLIMYRRQFLKGVKSFNGANFKVNDWVKVQNSFARKYPVYWYFLCVLTHMTDWA